jgi:hypothetical protein
VVQCRVDQLWEEDVSVLFVFGVLNGGGGFVTLASRSPPCFSFPSSLLQVKVSW